MIFRPCRVPVHGDRYFLFVAKVWSECSAECFRSSSLANVTRKRLSRLAFKDRGVVDSNPTGVAFDQRCITGETESAVPWILN
jgi:hypothetical protein